MPQIELEHEQFGGKKKTTHNKVQAMNSSDFTLPCSNPSNCSAPPLPPYVIPTIKGKKFSKVSSVSLGCSPESFTRIAPETAFLSCLHPRGENFVQRAPRVFT